MVPLIFKNDLQAELEFFWKFINSDCDFSHKGSIFKYFVSLEKRLTDVDNDDDKKNILKEYLLSFRNSRKESIERIEKEQKDKLESQGEVVLEKLAKLMDYKFEDGHKGYVAVPVVLPFSPIKGNVFYFSILALFRSKTSRCNDVLSSLAHEVSHFMLFDILEQRFRDDKYKMSKVELYFLKEILVVLLLKDETLIKILGTEEYKGNSIIQYLNIEKNGFVQSITDYFNDLYIQHKLQAKSFDAFLIIMIEKIKKISIELVTKESIWNECGLDRKKDSKEIQEYGKPIVM